MAEKPILFNTDMVCAILDGRKTQTRRVIRLPEDVKPYWAEPTLEHWDDLAEWDLICYKSEKSGNSDYAYAVKAPYKPGDVLWVREAWAINDEPWEKDEYIYRANIHPLDHDYWKWRPSIHMTREAVRIFLRVKDVRLERLKEISASDVMDEGCTDWNDFVRIWDSTIKPADRDRYGWDASPWVWVIEFERIERPEGGVSIERI